MNTIQHYFIAFLAFSSLGICKIVVDPASLRANGLYNHLGLGTATPRLSWRLQSDMRNDHQTAYQIRAASDTGQLRRCKGSKPLCDDILWDTGKVVSSATNTTYSGTVLGSRSAVFWQIRSWDAHGRVGGWSDVGYFELGLLEESDWTARWIANEHYVRGKTSLPVFAKTFKIDCPVAEARLYQLGLGLHETLINGKTITDEVLAPGDANNEVMNMYSSYNVTSQLLHGDNTIGVELGKALWSPEPGLDGRYMRFTTNGRQLKLISQLEWTCADGSSASLLSDNSWLTTTDGPLVESSWYGGEEYDARKELGAYSETGYDYSTRWVAANVSTAPSGVLVTSEQPPLKVVDTITAKSVAKTTDGSTWLIQFPINYAGWFEISMKGERGERILMTPGERINSAGIVQQMQWTTGYPIFDGYTFSGSEPTKWRQKFMYHGFEYLNANLSYEPQPSDFTGYVIRSSNEVVGTIETSSALFNKIHAIIDRSIQSNLYSVMTDCPHREKWGWLEQTHLVFDAFARIYDMEAYGRGLIRTIANAQLANGMVPTTAPEYLLMPGAYRDDPNWGSAFILVPEKLYRYYGDVDTARTYFDKMAAYMGYLQSKSKNNLLEYGLGDWVTLDRSTPLGVTGTLAYAQDAAALASLAAVLGRQDDADYYSTLHASILSSFHATFFVAETNSYASGSQASLAIALDIGAVPAEHVKAVADNLVSKLEQNGWRMTVGEVAMPSLFRALQTHGYNDVLFKMMNVTTYNSYGYMAQKGSTSLWEEWNGGDGGGSLNHFMLGFPDTWMMAVGGITQRTSSVAWKDIDYRPLVVGDLTHASSSYRSPQGLAVANWVLDTDRNVLTYDVTVPVGSQGWVYLSGTDVKEGGKAPEAGKNGIISVGDAIVVGSGSYKFTVQL